MALAILLAAGTWVVLVGAPRPASAAPVALGQAAPTGIPAECKGPAELVESSTSGINPYVVPRAGMITSWSTNAGAGPGQAMKMKVFRPVGGVAHTYTVIAHDGPRLLAASVLNTFSVDIPVQAGDVIGLNAGNASVATPNACLYPTNVTTDILDLSTADTPDGASVTFPLSSPGGRPNVAATLQPTPTVTAIRPSSGWFLGGTQVTITGSDFEGTSAVSFGETPASDYSVDSETQITAISPPGSVGATVDVGVVTSAGTSATGGADKFTYTAQPTQVSRCTVPKLKGKTLKAAKKKLKKAGCKLGELASVIGVVATVITPCPSDVNASWTLDTSAYPFHNGANTVAICASDFATLGDPNTTCSPARTINVDNSCTNSPVPGGESLSAQFATSRREETTVPFGRSAKITGRLSNSAGDAIPGATICLQTQTLDNHRSLVPLATVTTDAHGRFSYDLRPGPNRRILIGYRYDTFQIDRSVRYYSRAEPTLKATPRKLENGKRVHLQGRVPGPGADGRVVVLQANVVGSRRWITFRRATSARKGIFRATYHFTATTQTTTYRFRAVVPNQTGYPWVEGASKPVKVRVTG